MQDSVSQQTPSHVSELDWIKEVLEHGLELLEPLAQLVPFRSLQSSQGLRLR